MTAARFINPFIQWSNTDPVRFEYTLVIIDTVTSEVLQREEKSFPWSVSDADLEAIGGSALVDYLATHPDGGEPDTAPPILDWPIGGPL